MRSLLSVFFRGLGEPSRFHIVQGLLKWHLGGPHSCFCLSTGLIEAGGVASVNWHGATKMNANLLIFVLRSLSSECSQSFYAAACRR